MKLKTTLFILAVGLTILFGILLAGEAQASASDKPSTFTLENKAGDQVSPDKWLYCIEGAHKLWYAIGVNNVVSITRKFGGGAYEVLFTNGYTSWVTGGMCDFRNSGD